MTWSVIVGLATVDVGEFARSFVLLVNLLYVLMLASSLPLDGRELRRAIELFLKGAAAIGLLAALQFAEMNLLGSQHLLNPFGPFTMPGPGGVPYSPHPLSPLKRPNALFYEPSVLGWFSGSALALALSTMHHDSRARTTQATIIAMGALASCSMTGFLSTCVVLLLYVFVTSRTRVPMWTKVTVAAGALIFIPPALGIADLASRFDEIQVPGSSGYYRLVAPVYLLSDSLRDLPLGYPLGHVEYIATKQYMMNWEGGSQTNLDNSFFLLSFYFGLAGLTLTAAYLIRLARSVYTRRPSCLLEAAVTLGLAATGALWAPWMALFLAFTIVCGRALNAEAV